MGVVAAVGPVVPAGAALMARRPRRPMRPSERARADQRASRDAERAAQRVAKRPSGGDRPSVFRRGAGSTVPVDWHRSTMAHLCSMYPFHADRGFGEAGVYFGTNVTAGLDGFYFDPFEFYDAGMVENPNMIVTGTIGSAKSGTVKALIKRSRAVYPDRFVAVLDPKGEYLRLADWLGIPVVKLQPGGRHQLNPMEADGNGDPNDAILARQGPGHADGRRRARPAARRRRGSGDLVGGRRTVARAGRSSRSGTSTPSSTPRTRSCCGSPA